MAEEEQIAAHRATLHAQAVAVPNIKSMVPLQLDYTSSHYSRWRSLFLNTVEKYDLSDVDFSNDPHWRQMDFTIKSWLFGTISPELHELVHTASPTSRHVWLALERQFIGNKATRALLLDAELRTFVQGDLSVAEYCRKMKSMADALGDLGHIVPDGTLVLNVLRGLNEKYATFASIARRQRPFPDFSDLRADLEVEEMTLLGKLSSTTSSSAFVAATSARPSSAHTGHGYGAPPTPHGTQGGGAVSGSAQGGGSGGRYGNGGGNRKRRRPRYNNNGGNSGYGSAPWRPAYDPWTGTFIVWPTPPDPRRNSGLLGPRPQQPTAQSAAQYAQPPQAYTATTGLMCLMGLLRLGPCTTPTMGRMGN
ncbi:hypothetical protein EJB05_50968, partial [Eragrostis curvula]